MTGLRKQRLRGKRMVESLDIKVKSPAVEANTNKKPQRHKPLPEPVVPTGNDPQTNKRKATNFTEVILTGSKGQKYTVVVPSSYAGSVPKVWEWKEDHYAVAELVAQGIPIAQIPDYPHIQISNRMTIYCWLEHPEFKGHIDGLVMETGWANRRERLNNLKRLNDVVLNKVLKEIDSMKLSDKNVGALLSAIQTGAKLIAQEKGEYIEESNITSNVTLDGKVVNIEAKLEDYVQSKSIEEQADLEKEFDAVGDDIIRSLTGSKD